MTPVRLSLPPGAEFQKPSITDPRLILLAIGLVIMFAPSFYDLIVDGTWTAADNSHAPFVFLVSIWLLWRRWIEAPANRHYRPAIALAWACLLTSAPIYVFGRILGLNYLEVTAFIVAVAGVVLMVGGLNLLSELRFPIFFMLFMIPLPNFLISGLSHLLKDWVSTATVNVLHLLGYPIGQHGVTISIGPYQLLVADACAGMRTLFMLEALGLLYLNLVRHQSMARNIILAILIIPISFVANVIRVILLTLITYYFGDEAGQGFLHEFAGIALFLVGLIIIILTDAALRMPGRLARSET